MGAADFPWQPLGALLVERGLLSSGQLEGALAEQRRSGRLLGQVLVGRGIVTGASLARALAGQHGVGVRSSEVSEARAAAVPSATRPRPSGGPAAWRPLGRLLVELEFVTESQLERVLAEQRRDPTRRLGELLVAGGYVSGPELALALAGQHGVEVEAAGGGDPEPEPVGEPLPADGPTYRVYEVAYDPAYRPGRVLYQSANFLEAADFACDLVQRERPEAIEIEKVDGPVREPVWTYSEARARAEEEARQSLVTTFGFDHTVWNTRDKFSGRKRR